MGTPKVGWLEVEKVSEEVIFESSSTKIVRWENENELALQKRYFPIKGYGNRVVTTIKLFKKTKELEVYKFWDGWAVNGSLTGSRTDAECQLDDQEFNKLYDTLKNIRSVEDFEKAIETAHEIESKAEEKAENMIEQFIDELVNLDFYKRLQAELGDERAREELKQFIIDHYSDC